MLDRARFLGVLLLFAGCSELTSPRPDPLPDPGPAAPKIQVKTVTSGANQPLRYLVSIDGRPAEDIDANGAFAFTVPYSSEHTITLSGMADHCNVYGSRTRSVSVLTSSVPVVVLFDVLCEARGPTAPVGSQRIAFVRNDDLFAVDADGSHEVRLTNVGINSNPAWSPDGTRVAFTRGQERPGNGGDLYTMDIDGSKLVRRMDGTFPLPPVFGRPAWSPDGSKLAFSTLCPVSPSTVRSCILVGSADADGAPPLSLGHPSGVNIQAAWAPDGTRIAFVGDRGSDMALDIYVQKLSDITLLTGGIQSNLAGIYLHPAWSPDGRRIAYVYGKRLNSVSTRFVVATMNADGSDKQDLAWAGDIVDDEGVDPGSLAWSPDGSRVAFTYVDCDLTKATTCTSVRSIKYVTADGNQQGLIAENAHSPSWRR